MIFFVNKPGIKYRFWLSVPERPRHVVFWFHGSTTEPVEELESKHPIEFELAVSLLPQDCIVVTPLIPKVPDGVNGRVVDPQCLSRSVLFDDLLDPELALYNRPDKEVLKIFDYVGEYVLPVLDLTCDRFMLGGFSAGGNFASLFAALHPHHVTHVMSLISCAYWLPVERMQGVRFGYPFGLGGLDSVSDIAPDVEAQQRIRYFLYYGELDENDPIEYFANNDAGEAAAIKSVIGQTGADRARHAVQFLTDAGFDVEGHAMPGTGHQIHDWAVLRQMLAEFLAR